MAFGGNAASSGARQCKIKGAPFAGFAFNPNSSAMRLHDVFDDCQTESRASRLARTGPINPKKSFKDTFLGFLRDAGTVVTNENLNLVRTVFRPDHNFSAGVPIFNGVIN